MKQFKNWTPEVGEPVRLKKSPREMLVVTGEGGADIVMVDDYKNYLDENLPDGSHPVHVSDLVPAPFMPDEWKKIQGKIELKHIPRLIATVDFFVHDSVLLGQEIEECKPQRDLYMQLLACLCLKGHFNRISIKSAVIQEVQRDVTGAKNGRLDLTLIHDEKTGDVSIEYNPPKIVLARN